MSTPPVKPRRKRRAWPVLVPVILLAVVGLALALPNSPVNLSKLLEPEPKFKDRTYKEWAGDLAAADKQTRVAAATSLGRLNSDGRKALPELVRVMHTDSEPDVRAAASEAVGKMAMDKDTDAMKNEYANLTLEAFQAGLSDSDPRVRHNVAMGLIKLKDRGRAAVPALVTAIADPKNDTNLDMYPATIRQVMLRAVGELAAGMPDGVATFIAILDITVAPPKAPPGPRNREGGEVTKEQSDDTNRFVTESITRRIAVNGLGLAGEHGRSAAPKIRELLKSKDADDRFVAAEALQRMGLSADGT